MQKIGIFFSLTFLWSYTIWTGLIPSIQTSFTLDIHPDWAFLGLIAPGLFAVILTNFEKGYKGVKNLLLPLTYFRVPLVYYGFCYLGVFVFYSVASLIAIQLNGTLPNSLVKIFDVRTLFILIKLTFIYTICEEIGWRGYALIRLSKYIPPLFATLLVGTMWAIWQIPFTYLCGSFFTIFSLPLFFIHSLSLSIIFAWLYFKTGKSLLLVGLLHGSMNTLALFFPLLLSFSGKGLNYEAVLMEVIIAIFMTPYLTEMRQIAPPRVRYSRSKKGTLY